jgi:hypothetical protein
VVSTFSGYDFNSRGNAAGATSSSEIASAAANGDICDNSNMSNGSSEVTRPSEEAVTTTVRQCWGGCAAEGFECLPTRTRLRKVRLELGGGGGGGGGGGATERGEGRDKRKKKKRKEEGGGR